MGSENVVGDKGKEGNGDGAFNEEN